MENENKISVVVAGQNPIASLSAPPTQAVAVVEDPTPIFIASKPWLRSYVWNRILENECALGEILNCVPNFLDSDKATTLLCHTAEFEKAQNVQVHLDRVLEIVKLKSLLAGKTLYLPGIRDSSAVLLRVDVPEIDEVGETAKKLTLHPVSLENKPNLDMVIIGAVAVSRNGYYIGCGNGLVDRDIGLLIESGCITPSTIIATIVHNDQVFDSLPENLFKPYDTPVDLIVTPTEVIRVAQRLPRPIGIIWQLVSTRLLHLMPLMQSLKKCAEQRLGHAIELKEPDTEDTEGLPLGVQKIPNDENKRHDFRRRQSPPIAEQHIGHAIGMKKPDTDTEGLQLREDKRSNEEVRRRRFRRRQTPRISAEVTQPNAEAKKKDQKRDPRRFWRFINRRRQAEKSEGQNSGIEGKNDRIEKKRSKRSSGNGKENQQLLKKIGATTATPDIYFQLSRATLNMDSLFTLWKSQAVEPTKRSLRVQTWKKIQENKVGIGFNAIFNRIPGFVDSDKAATLLSETEEFKKAQTIKVNIDRALHAAKLAAMTAKKTLYLPGTRDSSALYLRVDVPADATEEQLKEILHTQDVHQHRTEISLENKVKLDLVVIGSVVVSRDGYRIGRGNGFADLDIGLLSEIGSITPETIIATMVHDHQVVDTLPINLFQKYDTPVDLIVTPTEVIRISQRLPRPANIFWELLSDRRLKIIPVLQSLKELEEKSGKVIVLKEEDTDIEHHHQNNRSRRRGNMRRRLGRRNQRRATSQTDTEQQAADQTQPPKQRNPRKKRFSNRRRRPTKSEGDQSGVEGGKSQERQERKPAAGGGDKKQKQRKNRPTRDFCIKLSNLTRDIRVKDLKTELRKRECTPLYISWKGQFGKCYLHFGNRNGTPSTEDDINNVLKSLNDLSLTITTDGGAAVGGNGSGAEGDANVATTTTTEVAPAQPPQTKTVAVSVELIKFDEKKGGSVAGETNGAVDADAHAGGDAGGATRIESVDTTTV